MKKLLNKTPSGSKAVFLWAVKKGYSNKLPLLGFTFCVIIPAALLIEFASKSPKVVAGVRASFITCVILGVIFLVVQGRIRRFAQSQKPLMRQILLAILLLAWWSIGIGIVYGLTSFANKLLFLWWSIGICWLLGSCCYIAHAFKKQRENKEAKK